MYSKIKAFIIATFYPLLYFLCQLVVQLITIKGIQYRYGNNIHLPNILNEKVYMMTLLAAAICFMIIYIINKIKQEDLFNNYKKISLPKIGSYVLLAIGLYILIAIMNFMLIGFFPEYGTQIMEVIKIDRPVFMIFVIGIIAPLIEELIFRGATYGQLEKHFNPHVAIFLQAVWFGAMHQIPLQKIQTFIMGVFLGYARKNSNTIWAPTIMHITSNMIACALAITVL